MAEKDFFEKPSEQSIIKIDIVTKYFSAWANVVKSVQKRKRKEPRIAYVDLYSGPGYYKDGTNSTPIIILEKALDHKDLKEMLVTYFNDD